MLKPGKYQRGFTEERRQRKKKKEGQISGASPQERVNMWFTHRRNLYGGKRAHSCRYL